MDNQIIQDLFTHKLTEEEIAHYKKQRQVDIELTGKCSLMCSYCISWSSKKDNAEAVQKMGIDALIEKLSLMLGKYPPNELTIAFVGPGEPTESPLFAELFDWALYHKYKVKLMTNLRGTANIAKVMPSYPEAHVSATISYHFAAMLEKPIFAKLRDEFFANFTTISRLGVIANTINTPMSPILLNDQLAIDTYLRDIRDLKAIYGKPLQPTPVEMYGIWHEKRYPMAYTQHEVVKLAYIHEQLNYNYGQHGQQKSEDTTVQQNRIVSKLKNLENQLTLNNCPCIMPMKHVNINLKGNIDYCKMTPRYSLGNIQTIDPNIDLFQPKPVKCWASICNCKASGTGSCLGPHKISLDQYYHAYYTMIGNMKIAKQFESEHP